jgi:Protein of unknown function (DUF3562)
MPELPDAAPSNSKSPSPDAVTIAALAQQTRSAHDVVKDLYDQEIAALYAEAKVRNFIGIIAGRRVKQRLKALRSAAGSKQA